jgi:hypothetical protein
MCRGLTSSGGSQEAGGIFSASTGLWPTAGLCTTIRAVHHDYWRKVREGENANEERRRPLSFATGVGNALRRAAKDARKTARMYGTPLYVWENGKVVAKKP